ncbi:peptidase S8 and S53 subtilisin kexin sedolisin [Natronococcus amylolyticus DSM 10524]|uniref:Peptidase S8 and S53 subtilisin kexin sedolisin n=2 Tax=Natronococcus amylolyticus TaxID=44470 RepID=L9XLN2_9EURY|nr:peptidase S8 and S53 subtilisin kexin sedolisin [Natronococcus amylolyticus DSM 10524]
MIGAGSAGSSTTYVVTGGSRGRLEDAGFSVTRELADGSVSIVSGPADAEDDLDSVSGVSGVTENFEVEFADPVERAEPQTTDDAAFTEKQWDKEITDTFEAHDYATGEGTRIVIADTGVDGTHPDLEDNFNEELSVSFVNEGEEAPHIGDSGDHGTHVAGTAAATGDVGVTGTAPDAEIVSVRVLGPDSSSFADILAGAEYAATIGADVANYSLGAAPQPAEANSEGLRVAVQQVMQDVARRGTLSTTSAGNDAVDLQQGQSRWEITDDDGEVVDVIYDNWHYLPGTVQGAVTVSASGPDDGLSSYSNYGTNAIEVGAPGGGRADPNENEEEDLVYSTVPGGYAWFAGTSMAAPQVAGLIALVRELEPEMNANQVENNIAHGAELVNGQSSPEFGAGRINALNTVQRI